MGDSFAAKGFSALSIRHVSEAEEPGASIAAVARKHGMNANLAFLGNASRSVPASHSFSLPRAANVSYGLLTLINLFDML